MSFLISGVMCTCDEMPEAWRVEEGQILFKEVFPITYLTAGDTDGATERAQFTVGPLICQCRYYERKNSIA